MRILSRAPVVALVLVLAACLQQVLVATGVVAMGTVSSDRQPLGLVFTAALIGLLFTGGLLIVWSFRSPDEWRLAGSPAVVLLMLAGGLLVLVHFYSYDPYYLPTLRRISDYENRAEWIAITAGVAVCTALVARFGGRAGLTLAGLACWWWMLSAGGEGGFH
jgi:hypothetical protein